MTGPALSVIVPTHDNQDVLRRCVTSWQRHGGNRIELLIIEDGCRDGTPSYLGELARSDWGASHVRVFHEPDVHEQRCTTRGFAEARAQSLLVWQDDMFVEHPWFVPELLRTLDRYEDLGVLGLTRGLDCVPSDSPIERWEDLTDWSRLPSTIGRAPLNWIRIQEVDFVIRPWLVRRRALEAAGGLDPSFALSEWDEADLCFRIRQAGWRVGAHGYERLGAYTHLGSSTLTRTFSEAYKEQVLQNGLLFHRRWDGEIARSSGRRRRTWVRRAPARAWLWTGVAAMNRLRTRARSRQ